MMILLKKIRHKLLANNKIGKYFLYAIGEILIVAIGIFLAFQLNINKENTANHKIETTYLKGILVDLDQDIYNLNQLFIMDDEQLRAFTTLQKSFGDETAIDENEIVKAIAIANLFTYFDGNNIVFEDMKSSGKITLISSDKLRLSILKYQKASAAETRNQVDQLRRRHTSLAADAFERNVDLNSMIEANYFKDDLYAELDPLDLSFFNQDTDSETARVFANQLSLMKALILFRNNGNQQIMAEAKKLRADIQSYLVIKGIKIESRLPAHVLTAIQTGDIGTLKRSVTPDSLDDCYDMEKESGNFLVHAISYKTLPALEFFVEQGADLEGVCEKKTPLMYAVKYGELDMTKYLVESGANLSIKNGNRTALSYSIIYEHPEIEAYLRAAGAE